MQVVLIRHDEAIQNNIWQSFGFSGCFVLDVQQTSGQVQRPTRTLPEGLLLQAREREIALRPFSQPGL